MLQDLRRALAVPLALTSVFGLLACPQLLPDDFDPARSGTDPSCARPGSCESGSGGTALGAAGAEPGTGGSSSGTGATAGTAGTGGSAPGSGGASSDAGSGGRPSSAGSGGVSPGDTTADAGPEPTTDPGCRAVRLDDTTHSADDNCLGIEGWNQVVTESSEVELSYQNGRACFEGTIEPVGWAVYNFTFADEQNWDATELDVEGFRLDVTGASPPPAIEVIYTDEDGDFCQLLTPLSTASVLFANSHPDCTGSPGSSTPDPTSLQYLRLSFISSATAYDIDFCVGLIAIP